MTPDRYTHDLRTSNCGDTYICEHCGLIDPDDGSESECPALLRAEVERLTEALRMGAPPPDAHAALEQLGPPLTVAADFLSGAMEHAREYPGAIENDLDSLRRLRGLLAGLGPDEEPEPAGLFSGPSNTLLPPGVVPTQGSANPGAAVTVYTWDDRERRFVATASVVDNEHPGGCHIKGEPSGVCQSDGHHSCKTCADRVPAHPLGWDVGGGE